MLRHGFAVVGLVAGIAVAVVTGPVAMADPSSSASPGETTSPPAVALTVTVTPTQAVPGDSVKIAASVPSGTLTEATAVSQALGTVALTASGTSATGTGKVAADVKAGEYVVTVKATADGHAVQGEAKLTVNSASQSPSPSPSPSVTTTPKGGVKTGGGGAAGGREAVLISVGAVVALFGVAVGLSAHRRRADDAH